MIAICGVQLLVAIIATIATPIPVVIGSWVAVGWLAGLTWSDYREECDFVAESLAVTGETQQ